MVNFYYREWTSFLNGDNTHASQLERLGRQIKHWEDLTNSNKDVILLGDANVCALSWSSPNYSAQLKDLANHIINFNLSEACEQLINQYTRVEKRGNLIEKSCLDHITTNASSKCSIPEVLTAGSSDHLATMITKYSKELRSQPQTVKKRSYKHFCPQTFIQAIRKISWFDLYMCENVEDAVEIFTQNITGILDKMAPVKTFQMRNNFAPWISENTKEKIKNCDYALQKASQTKQNEDWAKYKQLRNNLNNRKKCRKIKLATKEDGIMCGRSR